MTPSGSNKVTSPAVGRAFERAIELGEVGVQVAARPWREDVALAVMAALESHFRSRPDFPHTPVTPAAVSVVNA